MKWLLPGPIQARFRPSVPRNAAGPGGSDTGHVARKDRRADVGRATEINRQGERNRPPDNNNIHRSLQFAALFKGRTRIRVTSLHNPTGSTAPPSLESDHRAGVGAIGTCAANSALYRAEAREDKALFCVGSIKFCRSGTQAIQIKISPLSPPIFISRADQLRFWEMPMRFETPRLGRPPGAPLSGSALVKTGSAPNR